MVYEPPYSGSKTALSFPGDSRAEVCMDTGGVATFANTSGEIDDVSCSASVFQRIDLPVGRDKSITVEATIDDYVQTYAGDGGYGDKAGWDIVWQYPWGYDIKQEEKEIGTVYGSFWGDIADILSKAGYLAPTEWIVLTTLLALVFKADLVDAPQFWLTFNTTFNFQAKGKENPTSNPNSIYIGLKSWIDGGHFEIGNEGKVSKVIVHGIAPPPTPTISVVGNEPRDTDTPYTFHVESVDPNNDPVKYVIDWGDGNTTTTGYNETGEPAVEVTRSYSRTISPYPYQVKAKAIDCDGMESDWSDSLPVYIVNHRPKIISLHVCWPDENGVDIPKDKVRRYLNYYYKIQSWDADINTQTIKYFMGFSGGVTQESEYVQDLFYGFYHRFNNLGYQKVTVWCTDSVGAESPHKNFTIHVINTLPSTPSNPSPTTGATIYVSSINPDSTTVKSDPTQVNLQAAYLDLQVAQTPYSLNQGTTQIGSANVGSLTTAATASTSSSIAEPVEMIASRELESSSATTGSIGTIGSQTTLNGIDLRWSGEDPDGDDVTYKIYFGASSPSLLIGTTENTCSYHYSGTLTAGNTYYWKVVATDEYGGVAEGPVWHFTVSNDNNSDNNNSSDTQQTNNAVSQPAEEYQTLA